MKKFVIVTALLSSAVFAANTGPLLVKSSGGGHVMPETARMETCAVFNNRVKITRRFGTISVTEVRNLTFSPPLADMIEQANAAPIQKQNNYLCDGPVTTVSAKQIMPNDTVTDVLLYASGSCGTPRQERTGSAATNLRAIVDVYCNKTYDIGSDAETIFCATDMQQCPDGSFVARVSPTCAFAACPSD